MGVAKGLVLGETCLIAVAASWLTGVRLYFF